MSHWDDIRIFLAVTRSGSMGRAAQDLNIDAATVSRRIARLEREVGGALFVRSAKGLALTEKAHQLMKPSEAAEKAILETRTVRGADANTISGQIRIGAPDGCATFVLPTVFRQLSALFPQVEFQVVALPRVFNLSRREADFAIAVSPQNSPRLSVEKIADYHLHLAAHKKYFETGEVPLSVAGLKTSQVVGYIPDMIFDPELDYLRDVGLGKVNFGSNSVVVQGYMLQAGLGVGVVHDFALPFLTDVERILVRQVSLKRSFFLVQHLDATIDPGRKAIALALKTEIGKVIKDLEAQTR